MEPSPQPIIAPDGGREPKYPYRMMAVYLGVILPLVTLLLSSDIDAKRGWLHFTHPLVYWISTTLLLLVIVYLTHFLVWRDPKTSFRWKIGAAIGGTIAVILCNVILALYLDQEAPDIYTSYLIGRLCFLVAISMLFCVGPSYVELDRLYDEGLHQMRMGWSAFAILFLSDPILSNYLHGSGSIPQRTILALVHLNFCGGITLVILPLWKLHELRRRLAQSKGGNLINEVVARGRAITSLSQSQPKAG